MKYTLILLLAFLLNACVNNAATRAPTPGASIRLMQDATLAMQGQDYARAMELAQQSLEFDPNNARAYSILGLIHQRQRNPELAQVNFSKAVSLAPNDVAIRNNYGNYLCANRNYREAQENFISAANNPSNPDPDIALSNAGLCALRANDKARASSFFSNALKLNGAQTTALYQLAKMAFENDDALTASGFLSHYLTHKGHSAKSLWLAADIENKLNNQNSRQTLLQQLVAEFPDSPEARNAKFILDKASYAPSTQYDSPTTTSVPFEEETTIPTVESLGLPSTPVPVATPIPTQSNELVSANVLTHDWILSRDPLRYTIQLYTTGDTSSLARITNMAATEGVVDPASFGFVHNGENKYTLISGDYNSANEARTALLNLSSSIKQYQPWIRRFDSIQRVISNKGIR